MFVGLLPVLERLRSRLDAREIGIGAVRAARAVGLLRGDFLPFGLFFGATFLALAFALSLLLRWPRFVHGALYDVRGVLS